MHTGCALLIIKGIGLKVKEYRVLPSNNGGVVCKHPVDAIRVGPVMHDTPDI